MSVDYTGSSGGEPPRDTESEGPMFAPTPMWDRSKKNRKIGAERRSFFENAAESDSTPGMGAAVGAAPMMERDSVRETTMSPNGDTAYVAADEPYVAPTRTTTVRDRNIAPAAIVGGLVAIAALAAVGWYATRPADKTLTPGGPAAPATSIATTPTSDTLAANTPPATAAQGAATTSATTTTTTTAPTRTTSTPTVTTTRRTTTAMTTSRPHSSSRSSATTSGVDAATTAPAQTSVGVVPSTPQTATPPSAVTTPTAPPVNTMPTPTPTPAPSTTTPDVTAPTSAPAPTTAPPTTSPQ